MITNICPQGNCECPLFFIHSWRARIRKQTAEAQRVFAETHCRCAKSSNQLFSYYDRIGGTKDFSDEERMREFDPMI
jgi:hypothetical protein